MRQNVAVELVSYSVTMDELKQQILTPVYRRVFAAEKAVHGSEFANAGQRGIKPQGVFEVYTLEYRGEERLRHDGKEYHIYRTYKNIKTGKTELYCEVRAG